MKGDVYPRAVAHGCCHKPEPLVAGKPDSIDYQLQDVFHTFKKGHRLMVQVQSTWYPLIDRNPQTFVPNINTANASPISDGDNDGVPRRRSGIAPRAARAARAAVASERAVRSFRCRVECGGPAH